MAEQPETTTMHINEALAQIERLIASQRNYQAASVIKTAIDYIAHCEKQMKLLETALEDVKTLGDMQAAKVLDADEGDMVSLNTETLQ